MDIEGPVAVFDFDGYYMGGVLSEALAARGLKVEHVTPAGTVSAWTINTNELPLIHRSLARRGIGVHTLGVVTGLDVEAVTVADLFSGQQRTIACRSLVVVGHRAPRDELHQALLARAADWKAAGLASVAVTGDALAPGAIVNAVYNGHKTARELGVPAAQRLYRRDYPFGPPEEAGAGSGRGPEAAARAS